VNEQKTKLKLGNNQQNVMKHLSDYYMKSDFVWISAKLWKPAVLLIYTPCASQRYHKKLAWNDHPLLP
jgi:hypothetical protein